MIYYTVSVAVAAATAVCAQPELIRRMQQFPMDCRHVSIATTFTWTVFVVYCLSHIIFQRFNTTMRFEGVIIYIQTGHTHSPHTAEISHSKSSFFWISFSLYQTNNMRECVSVCSSVSVSLTFVFVLILSLSLSLDIVDGVCMRAIAIQYDNVTRYEFQKHTDNNKYFVWI